jgi:hypothetical protein
MCPANGDLTGRRAARTGHACNSFGHAARDYDARGTGARTDAAEHDAAGHADAT